MGTSAPDSVRHLVDRFDQNRKVFLSGDHKEEQLRLEFLNPFFESLGWGVANRAGLTETGSERSRRVFKPVVHLAGYFCCPHLCVRSGEAPVDLQ